MVEDEFPRLVSRLEVSTNPLGLSATKQVLLVNEPMPCCFQKLARVSVFAGCGARHAAGLYVGHLWALGRACDGARCVSGPGPRHVRV